MSMSTVNRVVPRSALRHRPIYPDTEVMEFVTPRASSTQNKYNPAITSRPVTGKALRWKRSFHWLVPVGMAMLIMVVVLWVLQSVWAWGTLVADDIRYGRPRMMQMDAFVGHESGKTPSHFIALNNHGRIEIIEFPENDASHARIFMGPQIWGTNADLVPITIAFVPSANDRQHPDMEISFQGSHILFRNQQGTFMPSSS